ncbi:hypothetical protein JRQ81_009608 [Phrynocephalus forsythii]|uniref:Cyclin-like domain-containing protein n=1 Tax=Phrynocephalus forsythii TaxID=171643 RepID=A0A9Q1ASB6_9SAUR|nr:hypothetical protein JRQ81_009608 [Phrynocephalus forsythii]
MHRRGDPGRHEEEEEEEAAAGPSRRAPSPVLRALLALEGRSVAPALAGLPAGLLPEARRALAVWMLEVCRDQGCPEEIFPLAVSYVDRYARGVPTRQAHLQLLGAVCVLLASKLRDPQPLRAEKLSLYTAHAFTARDILDWEPVVLGKLQWDLMSVTSQEFLDPILQLLPLPLQEMAPLVKKHTQALVVSWAIEYPLPSQRPSVTVAGAIAAAALRLLAPSDSLASEELVGHLASLLHADAVRACATT